MQVIARPAPPSNSRKFPPWVDQTRAGCAVTIEGVETTAHYQLVGRVDALLLWLCTYLGKRLWQAVRLFEACHRVRVNNTHSKKNQAGYQMSSSAASVAFDIFQIQIFIRRHIYVPQNRCLNSPCWHRIWSLPHLNVPPPPPPKPPAVWGGCVLVGLSTLPYFPRISRRR